MQGWVKSPKGFVVPEFLCRMRSLCSFETMICYNEKETFHGKRITSQLPDKSRSADAVTGKDFQIDAQPVAARRPATKLLWA